MEKTILITGANRGIGLGLAQYAALRGYKVIGTARDPGSADELNASSGPEGAVRVEQLDSSLSESVEALAQKLVDVPIDIVINNAGIFPHECDSLVDFDDTAFIRCMQTNTLGPIYVTRALLPNLKKSDQKTVVQISSNLGSIHDASKGEMGFLGYRTSKAALNMVTATIAHELRPMGITCVALHPGWVKTDLGGPHAPLSTDESVSSILDTIETLEIGDSGRFMDNQGKPLPW